MTAAATTCPTAAAPVAVTDYAYDDLDRLMRVTEVLPAAQGGNRVTETVYNADDSVHQVKRAVGTALAQTYATTTYSANGLPVTLTDAKGNRTTYEYDGHDRRVKLRYPHPTTVGTSSTTDYEQYGYNAVGSLTSHRKRSGETVTFAYDNLHRLTSRSYPTAADNVAFAYDLLGRRTQARYADNSHTVAYVWDAAGRLTSTTAGGKTLAYQYDAAGNRTRLTWPETSFYVTTTYDALNRPSAIKELGTTNLATYAYDDLSRRTTVTLGNGTTTSYGYSPQGALASLSHNLAGTAQDQTLTYTRNPVQEIVSQSWTNDLYQWTGYANGTQSYTANGLNQYTTAAGATLTHDARGNLTGDGVWTYTFDADNKLKSATKTGYTATLAYDAEGRLRRTTLGGTVTALLYDGMDVVAGYNSSGNLQRRYVHGPGVDEPLVWYEGTGSTDKRWLYADHQGSIIGTANSAGSSTAIYSYGPYGEPNVTTGARFRYTGQQYLGELNLYYYKARFYSPALGRFLQTDPIGTADDLNLYAYVGNNPVNFSDPTGLSREEAILLACGPACSGVLPPRPIAPPVSGIPGMAGQGDLDALFYIPPTRAPSGFENVTLPGSLPVLIWNTLGRGLIFNEGAKGPSGPADILTPNGHPVGHVDGGATPDVRTVTPGQLDGIIDGLKGLGARPGSKGNYPGEWYDLPHNQGGFGVRDSQNSGRTVDINIPGVPDVTKVHQKP